MKNFLKKLINKKEAEVECEELEGDEEKFFLVRNPNIMDAAFQYRQLMFFYEAGIELITAKLQILNKEFQCCNDRNPIENIKSRIKSMDSIKKKMEKLNIPISINRYFHSRSDYVDECTKKEKTELII